MKTAQSEKTMSQQASGQPTDETFEYWIDHDKNDLALRVAVLHQQRRELANEVIVKQVFAARSAIGQVFLAGEGLEVGAGSRPFPLPPEAKCFYGDVRDGDNLDKYFSSKGIKNDGFIDAQTFEGLTHSSLDFLISAHVIEHLENPIRSIKNGIKVLKPGGIYIIVVPDRRYTFDKHRAGTSIEHLLSDEVDDGEGTRISDYVDFIEKVSVEYFGTPMPSHGSWVEAERLAGVKHDIHFHAWNSDEFLGLLQHVAPRLYNVVGGAQVVNENIYVLKKI